MKKTNAVQDKSYAFALRVINLYRHLTTNQKEYVLSKQILRSGTSIGANIEEALGAHTKKDFLAKLSIANKEARETRYWLRLLNDSRYIEKSAFESIFNDCEEVLKIIGAISKSTKESLKD
jgi:four helix bundle protein